MLLSSLICSHHFAPGKARKILENFFADQYVKDKFQSDSRKVGVCFRTLIRESLELYLFEKQYETPNGKHFQPLDNLPSDPFFDRQWAQAIIHEAMRRVREICLAEGGSELFECLLDDLSSRSYQERPGTLSLRTRYRNSEKAKHYLLQQLEALLMSTISDPRLVMQEWQALHQILPEAVTLDPEILTQHFLSSQDMSAFWLELQSETVPGLDRTFRALIQGPDTTLAELQKTRQIIKQQNPGSTLPLELLEAMLYTCLAVELLRFKTSISETQRRTLPRGLFWLSKQQWLDPQTRALAAQAEQEIQHLTANG
ncbi:MAG: hypothetical protein GX564_05085 [Oligosphaeraceae bacterium]|nr:hypothetical protein [Oligosphaeraceae bacterium]